MANFSTPVSLKPSFSYYGRVLKRVLFGSLRMKRQLQRIAAQARREKMKPRSSSHRVRPVVLRAGDGTRLSGWLMTPRWPEARGAVLYFSNGSEEALWLAAQAAVLFPEMTVLVMQYRPASSKDKRAAVGEWVADGVMLYDWLADSHRHLSAFPIVVMGRDFGAGVTAGVAALRPAAALTLISPDDLTSTTASRLNVLRRRTRASTEPAFQFAHRSPVLVLRAEKDAIVAPKRSAAFLARLPAGVEDKVFTGADHYDLPYRQESQDAIAGFLHEHVIAPLKHPLAESEAEMPEATPGAMPVMTAQALALAV